MVGSTGFTASRSEKWTVHGRALLTFRHIVRVAYEALGLLCMKGEMGGLREDHAMRWTPGYV